uniref:Kelch-like protein diablo n=1 Tax=Zeugodacus cucurbitae TaxID=28588 RepID=A0A0A1X3K2_ZEUCU
MRVICMWPVAWSPKTIWSAIMHVIPIQWNGLIRDATVGNAVRRCCKRIAGMASAGRFIYVVGGDCVSTPTNMVERYDTRINKWTQLIAMQVPKVFPATIYFNNRLTVCGNSSNDEDCALVEEFDETTNKWIRKNKMPIEGPFSYVVAKPEWVNQLEALN